ncbi:MAG: M48 family metalloprotease [Armatimonadota bacterium]|nr:M48 family metalloprotease [Armatimonadota bacterium]
MVVNPPLILVSALFFLALASALCLMAWLVVSLILRLGRNRLSHTANKRSLMIALGLPPLLAALPTLGGATLRHSHAEASVEHHSMACQQMFVHLFAAESAGTAVNQVAGAVVNGVAWLLLGTGVLLLLRLIWATLNLEDGLRRYLSAPSAKLAASLARVSVCLPGLPIHRFSECSFPAAYSSVFGLRHVRCVLSRDFVSESTEDELDAVVAHEASHLHSRDVPTTFALGILNCLFFPLRPVRLLVRRWREEAELACDDAAVAATRQPLAMAAAILRASGAPVRPSGQNRSLPSVVMPFADEAACAPGKRVERLLAQAQNATFPRVKESRLQVWGAWATTLVLGGLGAAVLLSPQLICFAHCSLEAVARLLP